MLHPVYSPKSKDNQCAGPSILTHELGQAVSGDQCTHLQAKVTSTAASSHLTACPTDERRFPYPTQLLSDHKRIQLLLVFSKIGKTIYSFCSFEVNSILSETSKTKVTCAGKEIICDKDSLISGIE